MHILSVGSKAAVAFVVLSFVVSTLFDTHEDLELVSSLPLEPQAATLAPNGGEPERAADLTSLLQSGNIHVELLGTQDKVVTSSSHSKKDQAKDIDDMSLFSGAPIHTKVKTKRSVISMVTVSGGQGATSEVASKVASMAADFRRTLRQSVKHHVGQLGPRSSAFCIAIVVLISLLCTCAAAFGVAFPQKFSMWGESQRESSPEDASSAAASTQRGAMAANKLPMSYDIGSSAAPSGQYQWSPGIPSASEPFLRSALSPFANALMSTPPVTSNQLALDSAQAPMQQGLAPMDAPRPPPLCATLVMPVCEARFGIPMYELAQLGAEGDLTIVGLSGNPLLRAVVRKIGNARTLEITMPEQNSAPRATISPSTAELAGHGQQGSRALEIRGIRGSFYGILEMRSSGACYVVKDGQTVLTIDGDAESLQLSIKSSVGLQLASVRCSAEPFGGVDHVEIRVEPAVDTVLVLAVVLAVLLLSPYLIPSDK